jgi:hypothetical protein
MYWYVNDIKSMYFQPNVCDFSLKYVLSTYWYIVHTYGKRIYLVHTLGKRTDSAKLV